MSCVTYNGVLYSVCVDIDVQSSIMESIFAANDFDACCCTEHEDDLLTSSSDVYSDDFAVDSF